MRLLLKFTCGLALLVALAAGAKGEDPLAKGTVWTGKLTQMGNYKGNPGAPPVFRCEFKVTGRTDTKFEAELHEKTDDLEVTYVIQGTIVPKVGDDTGMAFTLTFDSVRVKNTAAKTVPINATYKPVTLVGNKLAGDWKCLDNKDETTLNGKFDFELVGKK